MSSILLGQPSDLVDLLLNFKALQVVKLRFMALKSAVNIVFSTALRLILTLKKQQQQSKGHVRYDNAKLQMWDNKY